MTDIFFNTKQKRQVKPNCRGSIRTFIRKARDKKELQTLRPAAQYIEIMIFIKAFFKNEEKQYLLCHDRYFFSIQNKRQVKPQLQWLYTNLYKQGKRKKELQTLRPAAQFNN